MSTTRIAALLGALGALALPSAASAQQTTTFERFEVLATANYLVTEDCGDGTTSTTRVQVIGGHEEEHEDGVTTTDQDFLTVRILNFATCDGEFINDRGTTNDATFTWSPSFQTAHVEGTLTTRDGRTVTVDMTWTGEGPLEVNENTNAFPGSVNHFIGREREADATGTVVVDGETLVDGFTEDADIESLHDRNLDNPAAQEDEF